MSEKSVHGIAAWLLDHPISSVPSFIRRPSRPKQHRDFHQTERRLTSHRSGDIAQARKKGGLKFLYRAGETHHTPGENPQGRGHTSAVHVTVFDDQGDLKEVRIYPLDAREGPLYRRGLPQLAEPSSESAQAVLAHSAERSKEFGTEVAVRDGYGVVTVK